MFIWLDVNVDMKYFGEFVGGRIGRTYSHCAVYSAFKKIKKIKIPIIAVEEFAIFIKN